MIDLITSEQVALEKFNKENIKHLGVAANFKNDEAVKTFFPEWEQITYLSLQDDTNTYYSYVINIENKPVGICTLTFTDDETAVFSQGFLNEFRGLGYSKLVRDTILSYLFSIGVTKVKAYIKSTNISSINSVRKTGIEPTAVSNSDLLEICYEPTRDRT